MATYDDTGAPMAQGKQATQQTANAAADVLDGAKRTARAAVDVGRTYATDAVNAAGQKLEGAKVQVGHITDKTSRYVSEQPLRAVGIAAAAGFMAAVVLNGLRRR